jgi:cytoskeletal protein RodZ
MAAGRETEVNSENGNSSGHDSSGHSIDSVLNGGEKPESERVASEAEQTGATGKERSTAQADGTSSAASAPEPSKPSGDFEPILGKMLAAARESRGISRAQVAAETRIPAHYLQMIESSDYGLISDQLYLMPFLRRYAGFLKMDGEEVAMRFVREVQRAEGAATMLRLSEPLAVHDRKRTPWGRIALIVFLIAAIIVLYIIASGHHREFAFHEIPPPATSGAPSAPNSAAMPVIAAPAQVAPIPQNASNTLPATRMSPPGAIGAPAGAAAAPQSQAVQPASSKNQATAGKDTE